MAAPKFRPYLEYRARSGGTERIYGDIVISEDFSSPAQITEFMVESGGRLNDHYLLLPKRVKVTLTITDTPIHAPDGTYTEETVSIPLDIPEYPKAPLGIGSLTQGALNAIGLGSGSGEPPRTATVSKVTPSAANRARETLELLQQIQADRILITVASSRFRVDDLGMSEIRMVRQEGDGGGCTISIDCVQVKYGEAEEADAVILPEQPRAQKKSNANAAANGAPVPDGEKKSALKKIKDAVFGP